ncbi:MAG: YcxB family protein [Mogibacterium sp.]|nr:YcxB family protein [Mogibacterium sp.]
MAKNAARKKNSTASKNPEANTAANNKSSATNAEVKSAPPKKKRDILYQVSSKRDDGVIKAYITFTYRVLHPSVSARLVIYGLIAGLPGIFFFKDLYWRIFFTGIGLSLTLLGFFRQYISLWITRRNDPDYKSGVVFTYNFTETNAEFFRGDEVFSRLDKYKDITNFYYDDDYYYLAIKGRDFFVIPKTAFTIGDAAAFEDFIYKKSKRTCRWIPNSLKDRLKKRRAEHAISSEKLFK